MLAALLTIVPGLLLLAGGLSGPGLGAAGQAKRPAKHGLQFGIYPGGGVGTVHEAKKALKENSALQLASLLKLSSGAPFVVHLYQAYRGGGAAEAEDPWLDDRIENYTDAGLLVELVARFRPVSETSSGSVSGYSDYLQALVNRYGDNTGFVSLQVTNEPNLKGAPDAADGYSKSVVPALIAGILAADREIARTGAEQIKLGFNWAYESSGKSRRKFWDSIGVPADDQFAKAVDWVGLNTYPGTWSPLTGRKGSRSKRAARTLKVHLKILRERLMPRAGLGRSIPIQLTENGWPTGPGRKAASQANILRSMVKETARLQQRFNISGYRWFALRDGNSSDSNFENHYGLVNDRYQKKPAFSVYRNLISRFSD